jgi:DNA-binding CsgD family transcriptional regulator
VSDRKEAAPPPPVRRDRSVAARRAARLKKANREARIVSLLNRGVSVAEIAGREGLSISRMRRLVQAILAERMPQPPAEFVALQVSRLNEALFLSYGSMYNSETGTDFEAIDRVVKIVRELDRYHGFSLPEAPRPEAAPRLLAPPAQAPIALDALAAERCGNGAVSD